MNRCLCGCLSICGIQYMYGKSSSSSLASIPNEVRTDLWSSSTSGVENSVKLHVGSQGMSYVQVPLSRCWSNVSCRQMYSCWMLCLRGLWQNYHGDGKVLWRHQGHWKWTCVWCWQSALVSTSTWFLFAIYCIRRNIRCVLISAIYAVSL